MMKLLLLFLLTLTIPIHAQNNSDNTNSNAPEIQTTQSEIQNLKSKIELPCFDSSETCVEKLTARAVANSEEIKVLDQTIKLAKRKGWTQYIDVSALDPLTLSVQILRNIFGGGERQQRKLSIAQLELRRADSVKNLRAEISGLLLQAEAFEKKQTQTQTLYDSQRVLAAVLEISYKSGELSTERMLPVWEKLDNLKTEIERAETERETVRKKLIALIAPQPLRELTRETARAAIIEDVERAWKLSGTTEELNLIVLDADEKRRVYKSELLKVFPEGFKHLPAELKSREIYPTVKNGNRKVQYIGKAKRFGFNFVIFRLSRGF